jgi:Protein of unknown function (DUF2786)
VDDVSEKIRKLLAKADSTTFPAEEKLLRAKAKELMVKYDVPEPRPAYEGPRYDPFSYRPPANVSVQNLSVVYKGTRLY